MTVYKVQLVPLCQGQFKGTAVMSHPRNIESVLLGPARESSKAMLLVPPTHPKLDTFIYSLLYNSKEMSTNYLKQVVTTKAEPSQNCLNVVTNNI